MDLLTILGRTLYRYRPVDPKDKFEGIDLLTRLIVAQSIAYPRSMLVSHDAAARIGPDG